MDDSIAHSAVPNDCSFVRRETKDGKRIEVVAYTFRLYLTGSRSRVFPTTRIWCRLTSPLRSLVYAWRVALLLVVVACSTPARAAAECGDYVTILNSSQNASHTTSVANPNPEQMPAKPCHGPNCSSSPAREFPPVPPAPSTSTNSVKESARNAAGTDDAVAALGSPFDRDLTSPHPIRRASSIFHPPRLG
jgi:hypothetical protein